MEVTSVVVRDSIPSAFEQTPRSPRKRLLLVKLCSQHKNGSRVNAIRLHKAPTHAIVNWVLEIVRIRLKSDRFSGKNDQIFAIKRYSGLR